MSLAGNANAQRAVQDGQVPARVLTRVGSNRAISTCRRGTPTPSSVCAASRNFFSSQWTHSSMQRPNRNEPCWCGSGQKYKKCHLYRETSDPVPAGLIRHQLFQPLRGTRICLHPNQSSCSGPIVQAHSISKQATLQYLATDGHVLKIDYANGLPAVTRVGIQIATTFTGFCRLHDKQLFSPIEDEPFTGQPKQCFLHAFRALAMDQLHKTGGSRGVPSLRQHDRGYGLDKQIFVQSLASAAQRAFDAGASIASATKRRFDQILLKQDFEAVQYVVGQYSRRPPVACSTIVGPKYDFQGNHLQDLMGGTQPAWLTFHSFGDGDRGVFLFVWDRQSSSVAKRFVDSFNSVPSAARADALLRLMLVFSDNVMLAPAWWLTLRERQQQAILLSAGAGHPQIRRGDLLPWSCEVADWTVESLSSHYS